MGALTEVREADFAAVLGCKGGARSFQVLHAAFAGGTIVFGAVVAVIAPSRAPLLAEGDPEEAGHVHLLTILSLVLAVQAMVCWGLATILHRAAFTPARIKACSQKPLLAFQALVPDGAGAVQEDAVRCFALIVYAGILRLALLEGVALFGLVNCLLGALQGTILRHPIYRLNAVPAVAFVAFAAATFPARERLLDVFRHRIQGTRGLI